MSLIYYINSNDDDNDNNNNEHSSYSTVFCIFWLRPRPAGLLQPLDPGPLPIRLYDDSNINIVIHIKLYIYIYDISII